MSLLVAVASSGHSANSQLGQSQAISVSVLDVVAPSEVCSFVIYRYLDLLLRAKRVSFGFQLNESQASRLAKPHKCCCCKLVVSLFDKADIDSDEKPLASYLFARSSREREIKR